MNDTSIPGDTGPGVDLKKGSDGGLLARLNMWLDRVLVFTALVLGGGTLTLMTCLSVVNVLVMRKALNAPILGAEDLMILALVVVVAIAVPFGGRTGAHIEIELLDDFMSAGFSNVSLGVMKAIAIVITAFLAWQLWDAGGQASRFGESSQNLIISFGPFYRMLAISALIYGFALVLELLTLALGKGISRINLLTDDPS
jgi:TRAP-type C4-dicarboxylate transport system permease small subunit